MIGQNIFATLFASILIGSAATPTIVEMNMDFGNSNGMTFSPTSVSVNDGHFYYNGFPTNWRLQDDGSVELSDFPRQGHSLVNSYKSQLEQSIAPSMGGYNTVMPIYLPFSAPLAIDQLPSNDEFFSRWDASIQVVDVDPDSPEYGRRFPLDIRMTKSFDSYRPANLLQLLPTLGVTLRPNTTYAAVVTDSVPLPKGHQVRQNPQLASALGVQPAPVEIPQRAKAVYQPLRNFLAHHRVDPAKIIAATVWTTGDPKQLLAKGAEAVLLLPTPAPTDLTLLKGYPDYCVVQGKIELPLFQNGAAPFYFYGGYLELDAEGYPTARGTRTTEFVVTIPKGTTMPATGFPHLFFHHGAGGKSEQVFQRGGRATPEVADQGNGPSRIAAFRGWASSGLSGHLGQGHLNLIEGYGAFPYDILQGIVLRNNYLQMVWERVYFRSFVAQLELDRSICPDADAGNADTFSFDENQTVLMGQSLGAWTGSLQMAADPRPFQGAIFGGVAGTWIQNLSSTWVKQVPLAVGAARLLPGESIDNHHPFLMLTEWVLGSVDPAAVVQDIMRYPTKPAPHIYIASGIEDVGTNEFSQLPFLIGIGVDLAGEEVGQTPSTDLIATMGPIVGATQHSYPVTNNFSVPGQGQRTSVVTRYVNTERSDGHHVLFDLPATKHQYGCFLEHLAAGRTPIVGEGYAINGPCN